MVSFYTEGYPRPQFVRRHWQLLNGSWTFRFDDENRGVEAGWHRAFPAESLQIQVPFSYETAASGIGDTTVHNVVWYARQIELPQGGRLILHFEGVDYDAQVWVDGEFAGSHRGGYDRFSLDITHLAAGKQAATLTVRAQDSLSPEQPRGKQRYKQESWGCWYVQTTGIWKSVWLEQVPQQYLRSVHNTPNLQQRLLELEVSAEISVQDHSRHSFALETGISFAGKLLKTDRFPLEENTHLLRLPLPDGNLRLWSPENPNLYEITYTLLRDGQPLDVVSSYFGLRTVTCEDGFVKLNGTPFYLRMILDQGYWHESGLTPPSEAALRQDIELARHFGYNGLRKHQKIEDERFLYWCDVLGMVVWSEMAATYAFTPRAATEFTAQWQRIVAQNRNHPCICAWVPFNESWGIEGVKDNKAIQSFVNGIYYLTKAVDATRPVITNDGWEHTISDIITIHDYREYGHELEAQYLEGDQEVLRNRRTMSWYGQMVFAQGYCYQGQPVILSEYGGIALQNEAGWGYGDQVADEEGFRKRFMSQNEAISKIPYFAGFCYTQLTDVEQEVNGLVDGTRASKLSAQMEEEVRISNLCTGC